MEENFKVMQRKGISSVGFRFAIFAVAVTVLQLGGAFLLKIFAEEQVRANSALFSFLLIIVTMDMIGFPLVYFLNKKLPAVTLEKSKLGVGKFITGAFICAGICGAGAIIGVIVNLLIATLTGNPVNDSNAIAELMLNSKPFMRILTVGILAPIFEELIFRKVLIDHLAKYGKVLAVVASGLTFGLFHGNFAQCFFAAGLGCFFAYIYLSTGRIRYSIFYHMMINLTTSVGTIAVLTNLLKVAGDGDLDALANVSEETLMQILPAALLMLGWMGLLGICVIIGIVLFFVNVKKFKLQEEEGAPTIGKSFELIFTNPGMWAFFAICIFLFVRSYL